uniref:Amino acid transporter n=1 Tax=Globisporangium ultimum (strain ATCC 200006 / CBS 805.95 / DAOM BR144) TaxID=431595 RepID=K3WF87_GLOUD
MAPPIVLLDEEQTRTLQATHARTSSNGAPPSRDPYRNSSFGANSSNQSYPMTPTNHPPYESRTNFTSNQPPRTNFTTGATQEPRTNFTSAASARRLNDHVAINAGGNVSRGTDLSSGQRSNETFTSSPRTNFTARRGPDGFDPNIDYTPVRLSDRMSSSSVTDEDHKEGGNGYAGSSSGLKLSITYILVGVAVGLGLGVLFTALGVSPLAAKWISLPGDLFLRALNSLVLPYVFCSVAVAIGDIVFVGKVSVVGFQTFKVFLFSWITTATMGMGIALLFRPLFRLDKVYLTGFCG